MRYVTKVAITKIFISTYSEGMYDYDRLLDDLEIYNKLGAEVFYIGSTHLGNLIPVVRVGNQIKPSVICVYGTHAREHITCALSYYHIRKHLKAKLQNSCIYFLPMLNIDGVELCLKGLNSVQPYLCKKFLTEINNFSQDFSLWKANIRGVDLNTNFPARWGTGEHNKLYPSPSDYIGEFPLSENENLALYNFTKKVCPYAVLSFHCKGEEIYWRFYQSRKNLERDYKIAKNLAMYTSYKLKDGFNSAGGFKDWCIQTLKIPAFTIEIGNDTFSHPFPYSELKQIVERNIDIIDVLLESVFKLLENRIRR